MANTTIEYDPNKIYFQEVIEALGPGTDFSNFGNFKLWQIFNRVTGKPAYDKLIEEPGLNEKIVGSKPS